MVLTRLILGMCIVVSAVAATAEEVRPVACDPLAGIDCRPLQEWAGTGRPSKPAEGSGTINPEAVVVTFHTSGRAICVALDSPRPDAEQLDTLRFDFTGRGQFVGAPTVTIRPAHVRGVNRQVFGPEIIQATVGGDTVPIMVKGDYKKFVNVGVAGPPRVTHYLTLYLGTAVEGKARFGKRVLAVRVMDGDGNLTVGDPWRPLVRGVRRGDTLVIDLSDGSFTKDVHKGCFGSPIEIGGVWYNVSLGETGKEITVAPADIDLGNVHIKHHKWSGILVGKKNILPVSGRTDPIVVPVDSYRIVDYYQWGLPTEKSKCARLCTGDMTDGAAAALVTVKAGKTTEVAVGSPLTASIIATHRAKGVVFLALSLVDASGREVTSLYKSDWSRPEGPKVTIRDQTGKTVFSTSFEWTCVLPVSCSWMPPADLAGTLTISLDYNTDPFKIVLKETTVTLK